MINSKPNYSECFEIAKYASKPNDSNPITLFSEKESRQSWVHLLDWNSSDDGFVTLCGQGIKPNTDNPSPRDNTFIQIIIDNNPKLGSTTSSSGEGQWVQCIMPVPKGKLINFMAQRLQHGSAYFIRAIEREREREKTS